MPIEVEKRKTERRKAKPGVSLKYRSVGRFPFRKGKYKLLGAVIDISSGGLSVEYDSQKMLPAEIVEYSLTVPDGGLQLDGLQMSTVSDFVIDDYTGCGANVCRRRGFRFSSLAPDQKDVLQLIIRHYTVDPSTE
jgi:hypothetical protein